VRLRAVAEKSPSAHPTKHGMTIERSWTCRKPEAGDLNLEFAQNADVRPTETNPVILLRDGYQQLLSTRRGPWRGSARTAAQCQEETFRLPWHQGILIAVVSMGLSIDALNSPQGKAP
jgi:hypothetical protein